jgi:SHS2 domain-containing protein
VSTGHRILPHTADLALEAWAPARGECIAEAVRALVESFADVRAAIPRQTIAFTAVEATDEDLLVRVLDEVIYQLDAAGLVPVNVSVDEPADGGQGRAARADVRFAAAPGSDAEPTGPVPKAVSLHELRFARDGTLWRCHVTVDI